MMTFSFGRTYFSLAYLCLCYFSHSSHNHFLNSHFSVLIPPAFLEAFD